MMMPRKLAAALCSALCASIRRAQVVATGTAVRGRALPDATATLDRPWPLRSPPPMWR